VSDSTSEIITASWNLGKIMGWKEWERKIPYIRFPTKWRIKIVPPFVGAMVRFKASSYNTGKDVSVYLDCHDVLGCMKTPYWEIYPIDGDTARCEMEDTKRLIEIISDEIDK